MNPRKKFRRVSINNADLENDKVYDFDAARDSDHVNNSKKAEAVGNPNEAQSI